MSLDHYDWLVIVGLVVAVAGVMMTFGVSVGVMIAGLLLAVAGVIGAMARK